MVYIFKACDVNTARFYVNERASFTRCVLGEDGRGKAGGEVAERKHKDEGG